MSSYGRPLLKRLIIHYCDHSGSSTGVRCVFRSAGRKTRPRTVARPPPAPSHIALRPKRSQGIPSGRAAGVPQPLPPHPSEAAAAARAPPLRRGRVWCVRPSAAAALAHRAQQARHCVACRACGPCAHGAGTSASCAQFSHSHPNTGSDPIPPPTHTLTHTPQTTRCPSAPGRPTPTPSACGTWLSLKSARSCGGWRPARGGPRSRACRCGTSSPCGRAYRVRGAWAPFRRAPRSRGDRRAVGRSTESRRLSAFQAHSLATSFPPAELQHAPSSLLARHIAPDTADVLCVGQ
jgi:hypothetical protein